MVRLILLLMFMATSVAAVPDIKITFRYDGKVYKNITVSIVKWIPSEGARIRVTQTGKEAAILLKNLSHDSKVNIKAYWKVNLAEIKIRKQGAAANAKFKAMVAKRAARLDSITLKPITSPTVISVTSKGVLVNVFSWHGGDQPTTQVVYVELPTKENNYVDGDEFGHTCYLIGKATYTSVGGAKKTVRHYTVNSVEALRSLK